MCFRNRIAKFRQLALILICSICLAPTTNASIQPVTATNNSFVKMPIGFHACFDGRCQCRGGYLIRCFMKGITMQIDSGAVPKTTLISIVCDENMREQALQNTNLPYRFLHRKVKFKLENCLELPEILRRANTSYLGSIRFSKNTQVAEDFFRASRGLQRLRVDMDVNCNEQVSAVPAKLFHNLSELRELRLVVICDSDEFSLPAEIFHTLFKLETLLVRLYHNDLDDIMITALYNLTRAYFCDLSNITKLQLDGNYMGALPPDIFVTLTELIELSLSVNELVALPEDLLKVQHKLINLDLSNNALHYLPRGIFDATPLLFELALANNKLLEPSNTIAAIQSLHYLYRLDLSYNRFERISSAEIYNKKQLTLLDRQHIVNPISVPHLEQYLRKQPKEYERPYNLTFINLSHNRLTNFNLDDISSAGVRCPYLLDFSNNHIQYIYALTHPPTRFSDCFYKFNFDNNPLKCDCTLAWIHNTNLTITSTWTCAGTTHPEYVYPRKKTEKMCAWSAQFCPERCECAYNSSALHINCASAQLEYIAKLPRPEQFSLNTTTLDISHNRFYELPSNLTFGYANVTRIHAANNRITTIQPIHLPPSSHLVVLDLRSNRLERLSADFLQTYLNESTTLQQLYLSDNPWLCDCEAEQLLLAVSAHRRRIPDVERLHCANLPNGTLLEVTFTEVCTSKLASSMSLLFALLGMALVVIVLISTLALYYKYSLEVSVWLYAHDMFLCCIREHELDKNKTFDAFISYAHQDEQFVNHILLPGLEQCDPPFRVCTHERNWLAGAYIPEQIVESVAQSRRTIIVLSKHFVASDWARMEFRTAHQCSLNEGRARIIIIKRGEITNRAAIDKELRAYLDMNTYLEWEDCPWFWNKLRYAMPHRKGEQGRAGFLELDERGRRYVIGDVEMNRFEGERRE